MQIKPTIPQGTNIFREIGLGNFQGTSQDRNQSQNPTPQANSGMPSGDPDIALVKSLLEKGDTASLMQAKDRINAIVSSKLPQQPAQQAPKPNIIPAQAPASPAQAPIAKPMQPPAPAPMANPTAPKAAPAASAAPSANSVLSDLTKLVQATYSGHNGPKSTMSAQASAPAPVQNPAAPGPKPV